MSLAVALPLIGDRTQEETITVSANTAPAVTYINQEDSEGNFYFKNKSVLIDADSEGPKGIRFNFGVQNPDITSERWMDNELDQVNFKWTIYRSSEGDGKISTGGHLAQYSLYCAIRFVNGRAKAHWGHKYHGSDFLASDSSNSNNATAVNKSPSENVKTYPEQATYGTITNPVDKYMPEGVVINGESGVYQDYEVTYDYEYNNSTLIFYTEANDESMFGIDLLYQGNYDASYFVTMQYEYMNYTHTEESWFGLVKEDKFKEIRGALSTESHSTRTILSDIEANGRWDVDFDEYGTKEDAILTNLYNILHAKKTVISFSWLTPLYGSVNGLPIETPFATKKTVKGLEVYLYDDGALRHNDVLAQINQQAERLAQIETGKTEGAEFEKAKKFYETINTFDCFEGLPGEAHYDVQKELLPTTTQNQDENDVYHYEAVYLPSVHLRLRMSNGTSVTSPDCYIDINTSFTKGVCENLGGITVAGLSESQESKLQDKLYAYFLNNIYTDYNINPDIKADDIYGFWGSFVLPETYFLSDIITNEQMKGLTVISANVQQSVSEINALLANTGRNIVSQVWQWLAGLSNAGTNNATLYIFYADPTSKNFGYTATGSFKAEDEGNNTLENVVEDEVDKINEEGLFEYFVSKIFGASFKDIIDGTANTALLMSRVLSIGMICLLIYALSKLLKPFAEAREKAHKRRQDNRRYKKNVKKEREAKKQAKKKKA